MKMSGNYAEVYSKMLEALLGYKKQEELTAFWPVSGENYKPQEGLLLIGRAVNGWDNEWTVPQDLCEKGPCHVTALARSTVEESESWFVNFATIPRETYNPSRSAFWRVARKVTQGILDEQWAQEWPGHIAWTNLYKVAPKERGNPSNGLCEKQKQGCINLLRLELTELSPAAILVLAGHNWYGDFVSDLGMHLSPNLDAVVEAVCTRSKQKWVLAKHPQGKPEDDLVSKAVQYFRER